MQHIKLDAIDSTNDFLKGLATNQVLENFTVVTAENQFKGKGQMGSVWVSESGKNLIMSVLINDFVKNISQIFDINIVVSIAVIEVLKDLNIPGLSIKWPNDIMSYNKKLGGILIENLIKSNNSIQCIVGFGLNVNQIDFDNLPKATSLAVVCEDYFDKEYILVRIIAKIKSNIFDWKQNSNTLKNEYINSLFKIGIPMPFQLKDDKKFMGIIQGVSQNGKLKILTENDTILEFEIKEIQMLY